MIQVPLTFRTDAQKRFFNLNKRNQCASGGFGSGKTYINCEKLIFLASTFSNYRAVIARYEESKLKHTTMKTFYEACPRELYDEKQGGGRADSLNFCRFVNGSEFLFINLKDTDEGMVRGLPANSVFVDQSEEISEHMYLLLRARVGRWNGAIVPIELLESNPDWPISETTGKPKVPSYFLHACNPDAEDHWIWRRFHPDSEEYREKFHKNSEMVFFPTTTATIEEEILQEMLENDPAWVDRFVHGKWGIPGGAIHHVQDSSILFLDNGLSHEFLREIIEKGRLVRVLDHGDTAPTCCLWFSAYKNWYFCYREYYKPNALISAHRENIAGLSQTENYITNIADPAMFKRTMQKYGGRWTQADEYLDSNIDAPPIAWIPGDNDELATRNRISELLRDNREVRHPITGDKGAPRLYFIQRSESWPNGCYQSLIQLKAQKRMKTDSINGRDIFSDERDDKVIDHAYDCIRYFCASHLISPKEVKPKPSPNSFYAHRKAAINWNRMNQYV